MASLEALRVVTYLRCSDPERNVRSRVTGERSLESRQDVENQRAQLQTLMDMHKDWIHTREYAEYGSGAKSDRPMFRRMMQDAKEGKFDVLVFWALDRLTREGALQTLNYLNQLSTHGVSYCSYTEQYLDTCGVFKDAIVAILAVIAKQERERISARVKAGLARSKAAGTWKPKPRAIDDLNRFREAMKLYDVKGLMKLFNCSRTTVYDTKRLVREMDSSPGAPAWGTKVGIEVPVPSKDVTRA